MLRKLQTLREKPELAIFDEIISLNGKINSIKSVLKNINIKEVKTYENELETLSEGILGLTEALQGKDMVVNVDFDTIIGSLVKVENAIKNIKEVKIPEFPKELGIKEIQINELLLAISTIPEFPINDLEKMFKSLEKKVSDIRIEIPETEGLDYEFLDDKFRSLEKAVKNVSISISGGGGGIGERANLNLDIIKNNTGEWVGGLGTDLADNDYYYIGYIKAGTFEWRIEKISKTDYSNTWANGTTTNEAGLTTAWTNRKIQTYTINL